MSTRVVLRLTEYEADILDSVLSYLHLGEYDGGPLWADDSREHARRVSAALRIGRKLDAATAKKADAGRLTTDKTAATVRSVGQTQTP